MVTAAVEPAESRALRLEPRVIEALTSDLGVAAIHLLGRVGSTNDEARRLGREGSPDYTLVVAAEQTAGRGRRRRHWCSGPGGLYLSLVLRPSVPSFEYAAGLQLAAGIAVAEALVPFVPEPAELLWPNDVLCRGQKIAGVLVESEVTADRLESVICGMGINVSQERTAFAGELAGRAASLAMLSRRNLTLDEVLLGVLCRLQHWDGTLRHRGLAPIIERWVRLGRATLSGARVDVQTAHGMLEGEAVGLSPRGGLLVKTDRGVEEVVTGELIRVRRRT